jgi:hypothetical protein
MTDSNEDLLHRLAPSIVEIISDKDLSTLGTGFVVTDDELIVTCRHTIADSEDKLMNSVKVRFRSGSKMGTGEFTATVVRQDQHFKDNPSIGIKHVLSFRAKFHNRFKHIFEFYSELAKGDT